MSAPEATTKGPTRCSQLAMGTAAFMAAAAAVVWVQSLWTAANGAPRQRIMAGCARTWPELELFLPLHMGVHSLPGAPRRQSINTKRRNEEYANWFFRSFFLFWPSEMSRTTIRVLFDEELRTDHNMTHLYVEANRTIHNCFARRAKYSSLKYDDVITTTFVPPALALAPYRTGMDRQQWYMFWADNFTRSEYVGFVDADTLFITYVDREDLFENGKPVVHGRIGVDKTSPWANAPAGTQAFLGLPEPMRCAASFPVVVKTAHLKALRAHVSAVHRKPFDEVFAAHAANGTFLSQFNVICAYLYAQRRDSYAWFIQDTHPTDWTATGNRASPNPGEVAAKAAYPPAFLRPKPRVAVHARFHYVGPDGKPDMAKWTRETDLIDDVLRRGFCDSPPFPKDDKVCGAFNYNATHNPMMYRFDHVDYNPLYNASALFKLHMERRKRLEGCSHRWPSPNDELGVGPP